MSLRRLQKNWDRFGEDDPLWAVLTTSGKERRAWSLEEFLATGQQEIDGVLHNARDHGFAYGHARALDFGCGVGRLTQALCKHFERVDGVDIAPSMIAKANAINAWPDRVTYHLNAKQDLRLFASRSFDFVYSVLVLQHMSPPTAKKYIEEFVRIAQPDGLVVFQVPSHRTATEPSGDAPRTKGAHAIAAADRKAKVVVSTAARAAKAGSHVILEVELQNLGSAPWPSEGQADSRFRTKLGCHWRDAKGRIVSKNGARAPLPHDLRPHESVILLLGTDVPQVNGRHHLELDVVQEHVGWFAESGSETVCVPFDVEGGRQADGDARPLAEPMEFRLRHPRVHRWLTRLGLEHLARSSVAKLRRQTNLARNRLQSLGRVLSNAPVMEMHLILRTEVLRVVESAGGTVLRVDDEVTPGGFHSLTYWVRSRPTGSP